VTIQDVDQRGDPRRVVARFDLTDASRPDRYWVLLARQECEVCVQNPGFTEDLIITTDAHWLVRWHTGAITLAAARRAGGIRIDGPRPLVRAFGTWGGLSPFAGVSPAPSRTPAPNRTPTASRTPASNRALAAGRTPASGRRTRPIVPDPSLALR